MARHIRLLLVATMIVLAAAAVRGQIDLSDPVDAGPDRPAVPEAQPDDYTLDDVIRAIQREGLAGMRADKAWPRKRSDFAKTHDLALPGEQVVVALGRKISKNPALDAYIKWQLLSFRPDLAAAGAEQRRDILRHLPGLINEPQPVVTNSRRDGSVGSRMGLGIAVAGQRAFIRDLNPVVADGVVAFDPEIAVLNTGAVLDVEGVVSHDRRHVTMTVRTAVSELIELRTFVTQTNTAVAGLAAGLVRAMPEGEERLALMLQETEQRMVAGNAGYVQSMEQFLTEADRLKRSELISPRVRNALYAQIERMARISKRVVRKIEIDERADRYTVKRDLIKLSDAHIKAARAYLKGEEPDMS
jgi:hypothetical protein